MEHIKTSQKDFFLYLLSNIGLYYCAAWLIALLYSCIDYAFGSINYYDTAWLPGGMRWAIASLLIVFPVYIWITKGLNKDLAENPEKKELRIRKWMLYLTLSLASIAIVVDLVALIYQFLSGEFATTFFLKVGSVALVAGMVFGYYFYELRRDSGKPAPARALFRYVSLFIVLEAIVLGFVIVGSPSAARERQYDARRISDLQTIQSQIVFNYWQSKAALPKTLEDLQDPISGFMVPADPEAQAKDLRYEYRSTGTRSFELCATFNREGGVAGEYSEPVKITGAGNEVWLHGAGRTCFTRTIDPEFYPVKPSAPRF